jgi:hypothetical protein
MVRHPRHRAGRLHPLPLVGLLAVGLLSLGLTTTAADPDPTLPANLTPAAKNALLDAKYIGVKKCKNCHKADAMGNQFGKWESSKHAGAFRALAGADAKKAGAEKDIEDPQKADECLKCHVTAFGVSEDLLDRGFKAEDGVQCEACHGPGENHMKARMKAVMEAAGGDPAPVTEGEIIAKPGMDSCLQCHNEKSPSFKPFCFKARNAEILHLIPGKHTEAEVKAMTDGCPCGDDCKCVHGADDPRCSGTAAGG